MRRSTLPCFKTKHPLPHPGLCTHLFAPTSLSLFFSLFPVSPSLCMSSWLLHKGSGSRFQKSFKPPDALFCPFSHSLERQFGNKNDNKKRDKAKERVRKSWIGWSKKLWGVSLAEAQNCQIWSLRQLKDAVIGGICCMATLKYQLLLQEKPFKRYISTTTPTHFQIK